MGLLGALLGCAHDTAQGPPPIGECEELDVAMTAAMSPRARAVMESRRGVRSYPKDDAARERMRAQCQKAVAALPQRRSH